MHIKSPTNGTRYANTQIHTNTQTLPHLHYTLMISYAPSLRSGQSAPPPRSLALLIVTRIDRTAQHQREDQAQHLHRQYAQRHDKHRCRILLRSGHQNLHAAMHVQRLPVDRCANRQPASLLAAGLVQLGHTARLRNGVERHRTGHHHVDRFVDVIGRSRRRSRRTRGLGSGRCRRDAGVVLAGHPVVRSVGTAAVQLWIWLGIRLFVGGQQRNAAPSSVVDYLILQRIEGVRRARDDAVIVLHRVLHRTAHHIVQFVAIVIGPGAGRHLCHDYDQHAAEELAAIED